MEYNRNNVVECPTCYNRKEKKVKRILVLMMAVLMIFSCVTFMAFAEETNTEYILGDVNGDGELNIVDVIMILRYLANWDLPHIPEERIDITGDVNKDGKINLSDASYYLRWLAKWDVGMA